MKLTISLAQIEVIPKNPEKNLRKGESFIKEAKNRGSDLICFPEMWTTGFNWEYNELNAKSHESAINEISGLSKKYGIWINGSTLALNENGKVSNTSILFNPKGERAGTYRKTHLFSLFNEDKHMAPGQYLTAVDTPWGLTGLSICYDIRFPELFRTYALKGVKVQLSPMAFPYPRLEHWKILVRARAIENQMFMIGTNKIGSEDLGKDVIVTYFGSSVIIDPWGNTVTEAGEKEETLLTARIDINEVDNIRNKMKVFNDRRPDLYNLK